MKMDKLSMQYFLGLASFFKARHLFWLSAVARPQKAGSGLPLPSSSRWAIEHHPATGPGVY